MVKIKDFFINNWPIAVMVGLVLLFYSPFFTHKLLPIPGDITVGMYYPWLDNKYPEYPANVPVKNPLPSDVVSLTYPLRLLSINLIKQGQWPLWNDQILSGTPLLANFQSASLYPLNLIYFIVDNFNLAWSWQVILQPLLSLFFCYWFLRSVNFCKVAALFGAAMWSLSSFFSIWGQYNTVIHAVLYLPLGLLACTKLEKSKEWGVVLAVAIAMSFYAGNPPMTLIVLLTLGGYCIFWYKLKLKNYLKALLFVILGIGLGATQLIPGLVNSSFSVRNTDKVALDNNIKYLPIRQLPTLVIPDFYGNPTTLNYWVDGLYDNLTIFAGVIPIILMLIGLGGKNSTESVISLKKFVVAGIIFSGILIIKNPISELVGSLPILGLDSMVMSRFFVATLLAIAVGTALGIESIINNRQQIKIFPIIAVSVLVLTPMLIAVIIYGVVNYGSFVGLSFNKEDYDIAQLLLRAKIGWRNSVIPTGILVGGWVWYGLRKILPIKLGLVILFGLMVADSWRFFRKYNSFVPEKYMFPQNAITNYLKTNSTRFVRESGEVMPSNMWMPYGLKASSGYDTLHSARYNGFISMINGSDITHTTNRYVEIDNFNRQEVDFLGISHLIAVRRKLGKPNSEGDLSHLIDKNKYQIEFSDKSTVVLKNLTAKPIINAVSKYKVTNNFSELNEEIKNNDLASTVILEEEPTVKAIDGEVTIKNIVRDKQATYFETESSSDQIITIADTYDQGWTLKIDGVKSKILVANYAFMAIEVPKGNHKISVEYKPENFLTGLRITLWSAIISVGVILVGKFGKNKIKKK